jgi:flagellar basal body-associated protein FliL
MTDIDQSVELDADNDGGGKRSSKRLIMIIGIAVLLLGIGGGVWFFLLGGKAMLLGGGAVKTVEAPLPTFYEMKPVVITVTSKQGPSHFVQLGASLQLADASGSEMIAAVLPRLQDAIRQTVLTFKSEELQTPEGVERLRTGLLPRLNEVLEHALGHERLAKATGGKPGGKPIENLYFSSLIVE